MLDRRLLYLGFALIALGAIAVTTGWFEPWLGSHEKSQEELSRAERERAEVARGFQAAWPAAIRTDCEGLDSTDGRPVVCIRRLNKSSYAKGEAITAVLNWKNLPAGASLMVHVLHDAPPEAQRDYRGPTGAMELVSRPVTTSGSMHFTWSGNSFPCTPLDIPTTCPETMEIGRYRLYARVHAIPRVMGIWGYGQMPSPAEIEAQKPVVHTASMPFQITGSPALGHVSDLIRGAAFRRYVPQTSSVRLGDLVLESKPGRLCARVPAMPPARSTLEGCVLERDVRDEIGMKRSVDEALVAFTGTLTFARSRAAPS